MAVEKAALDYSSIPAMTRARQSLEKAVDELQDAFNEVSLTVIKRRLKKRAKDIDIRWPVNPSETPSKQ